MGKALHDAFPAAREVFQEVDDALELGLSRIVFAGPAETLTLTENGGNPPSWRSRSPLSAC